MDGEYSAYTLCEFMEANKNLVVKKTVIGHYYSYWPIYSIIITKLNDVIYTNDTHNMGEIKFIYIYCDYFLLMLCCILYTLFNWTNILNNLKFKFSLF